MDKYILLQFAVIYPTLSKKVYALCKMGDEYENVCRGTLSLKGVADKKIKK